jgi:translation initiation factor IF-3
VREKKKLKQERKKKKLMKLEHIAMRSEIPLGNLKTNLSEFVRKSF